ncbi:MAG: hypothetical protein ACLT0Z_11070 [Gemmiger sp.]
MAEEWHRDQDHRFQPALFINAVAKLQNLLQNNAASNSVGAAYADAANLS